MKKSKLNLILIASLFMLGCRSYSVMENLPYITESTKLPAMDVVLDEQSFATVTGYATSSYGKTSSISYTSQALHNASLMYETNMYGIINKIGERKGKVVCRLLMADQNLGLGWTVLSGITCCALNLFGMPLGTATVSIIVEIDFLDNYDNIVATYRSKEHKEKKYYAMYWGYMNAGDAAFYECFKQCLGDINAEIKSDYNNLKSIYLK